MPAKESIILRPRSHGGRGGGGVRGVTISGFPYPVLPPPVLFCPFVSRLRPLLCFSRYHVNHAVWLPKIIGRALARAPYSSGLPPPCPPPLTRIRIFLKTEIFFLPFSENWASTRSVLESFSPIIHTKTLKRWKLDSNPYRACAVWRMTSSHLKTSRKPHENDKDWFPQATEPEL